MGDVEAQDKAGCFAGCGGRNTTSPCWIGCFFDTVLGDPGGGFARLEAIRAVTPLRIADVAARYVLRHRRTVVKVRADLSSEAA